MKKIKIEDSHVKTFRDEWLKEGFDLINITSLCTFKLGESGWCNGFNEPDETCHHIQCWYRDEQIATFTPGKSYVLDDERYILYVDPDEDITGQDFIMFRKVKL